MYDSIPKSHKDVQIFPFCFISDQRVRVSPPPTGKLALCWSGAGTSSFTFQPGPVPPFSTCSFPPVPDSCSARDWTCRFSGVYLRLTGKGGRNGRRHITSFMHYSCSLELCLLVSVMHRVEERGKKKGSKKTSQGEGLLMLCQLERKVVGTCVNKPTCPDVASEKLVSP
jgi:hypothetical protein